MNHSTEKIAIKKLVLDKDEPVYCPWYHLNWVMPRSTTPLIRSNVMQPRLEITVRYRPACDSPALSGGFDGRYIYRLALPRLAAWPRFRLLVLIDAFFVFDWVKNTS